jgi:hypothetical protein
LPALKPASKILKDGVTVVVASDRQTDGDGSPASQGFLTQPNREAVLIADGEQFS